MQQSKAELTSSCAFDYMRALRRTIAIIIAIAIACSPLFALLPNRTHQAARAQSSSDLFVYGDALAVAWQDWSWNTAVNFTNAAPTFNGSAASIAIAYNQPWAGALFGTNSPVATAGYTAIAFQAYGASPATQIRVFAKLGSTGQDTPFVEIAVPGGMWTEVVVPFGQLGNPESISAIAIQDSTGMVQPMFFVDDVRLISGLQPTPTATSQPTPIETETPTVTPTPTATLGEPPSATATPEPTASATSTPEPTPTPGNLDTLPVGEFDGPTLSLTTTLEGRVQLVWTTVPDAFYNLRYGTGDRSKIIYVTDTQWIGDLFATGANTVTFSVVAITSQGVSRESNVVSLGPSGEVALGSGVRLAQLALTPADCERLTQQVEYQQHRVVNTSSEVRDRQIWINTGPAQCLSLLANQLGQLGSDIFWSCELVLQPARIIGISRIPAQYTLGWVGKFFGSALAGIGVNQLCNQIKTLTNWSTGVLTLRETADSCGSGSARWTLRIDKITTITPGVEGQPPRVSEKYEFKAYDVQCVQPKPIRYIGPDRIVYTDGTYEIVDPNTVRNAILSLMLALQPLTWTKTEAIAHRADRVSSPDNTHEAIKRAFEKGAKYIEVDTQLASDGQVIIAHGSVYKLNQGFVPDAPTVVYGPTDACHGKNMEVDVTPFLTGNCDVGTQMALASEGESWTPKFRGERYPILQNVISTPAYSDYCGWFIELKKSEHPSADKAERNRQLGETVQALLEAQGAIERCANRGQNVWVTSFEDSALAGVTDDRIHKLRVVSRFSLGDWTQRIADWLSRGYDGVAIDLAVADEVVEGKSLPEYIRSRGLKAVAYTLLPGSQSQSTNQEAIDKKFDFFLTDILDDLLIRNGDKQPITPFYTVTLSAGEARALVIRNHEVYPVTTTLFLDSYGNGTQPLPIGPVVPGDGWVSLLFDTFPTSADTLVVEKTEVTHVTQPM